MEALIQHLTANVPWGAEVTLEREGMGDPFLLPANAPAHQAMHRAMAEAFGTDAVESGSGGSIPFVAEFARMLPGAALMITGAGDPQCNAHAEDESLDLADLERSCLAEALFLGNLAG